MIRPQHRICTFFVLLLLTGASLTGGYLSPDNIDGSTKIDAQTLIKLARPGGDEFDMLRPSAQTEKQAKA